MHHLGLGAHEWKKSFFSTELHVGVDKDQESVVKCYRNPIAKLFAVHISKTAYLDTLDGVEYAILYNSSKDLSKKADPQNEGLRPSQAIQILKDKALLFKTKFSDITPGGMLSKLTEKLQNKLDRKDFKYIQENYEELIEKQKEGWKPDESQKMALKQIGEFIKTDQLHNPEERIFSQIYDEKLKFLLELMRDLREKNSINDWEKSTFQEDLKALENAIKEEKWTPSKEDIKNLDKIIAFLDMEKVDWEGLNNK